MKRPTAWLGLLLLSFLADAVLAQGVQQDGWVAREATTLIRFDPVVLGDLGIEIRNTGDAVDSSDPNLYRFVAPKPWALYFTAPGGAFEDFLGGNLRHLGGFDLRFRSGSVSLQNFEVRPGSRERTLRILDTGGTILLDVDHIHFEMDLQERTLVLKNMDVRLSEELARRMGEPRYAGIVIASMAIEARIEIPTGADLTEGQCSSPNWPNDPGFDADVSLIGIGQVQQAAREPGVRVAVTPSATLENVGTADVPWYQAFEPSCPCPPYNNDQHPFLVWALYRVADGRIEQLGQSPVKHAFLTINFDCPCPSGDILWAVGCKDTYGVGTNNSRQWLAPRDEITANSGIWARCGSHFDPDCDGDRDHGGGDPHDTFDHRLVVAEPDLETDPADYYFEAWYIVRDDVNIFNTMGYRKVTPALVGGAWTFPFDTSLIVGPAVDAWIDPANPPPDTRNESVSTGKGHLQLLVSVASLGGGLHRYEYALMNHDFDAQIEAFEIPLPQGIVVSNARFKDLDDEPANDWQVTIGAASIEWQTPDPSNALDWGTLFNFGFDANVSSQAATAILDILEPGVMTELAVASLGPAPAEIFSDGFESGDTTAWSSSAP